MKELLKNEMYPSKNLYIKAYTALREHFKLGKIFKLQINKQKIANEELAVKSFLKQVKLVSKNEEQNQ